MRVAALDLGSNTTLLLVAEMDGSKIQKVLHDETRVTKMGQGVHAKRQFHPDALVRVKNALMDYAGVIKKLKCDKVIAVATSAARDVANGPELIAIGKDLGIPIHIIPGKKEAELTFYGAQPPGHDMKDAAVIDVGGGSTEVIGLLEGIPSGTSVDVGSVRLTELFVTGHPISDLELSRIQNYAREAFSKVQLSPGIKMAIAVAGTPTTLAAVDQQRDFSEEAVNGYRLSLSCIDSWIRKLAGMTVEEREKLPGMQPKRADVIVTGSIILTEAMRRLNQSEVIVSTKGVRYGVAMSWQEF